MNEMIIMYANHKKSFHKRNVPANLEKDVFSFLFILNILNFTRGTYISSSLILNILIGWAVEYCGDVILYCFLLADNTGY